MREISEFLEAVGQFDHVSYYRGHSDAAWQLLPSIARINVSAIDTDEHIHWKGLELDIMRQFEKHGSSLLHKSPKNDLEWLIHAQHHGLPTRLLDWSTNPLKALFFAVENPAYDHVDGVLFGVEPALNYVMERFVDISKNRNIIGFYSSSLNNRVIAQEGCFTIYPLPNKWESFTEIEAENDTVEYLSSYVVPKEHKPALRKQLNLLGITHKFMFPDLDGLAKSIVRDIGL
ncbi:FRG domain-containing protein [Vibrio parahaemolyticus]|uniref:FRG domain-containing protein n=1 Tax=unclassified Vibrio TaxID=2614977 RepID=UPI001A2FD57F|nr:MULTISPECIES: FRG domain-containing protein [unclassified Vibrio]ELB2183331.1 FRG domain-containing protein [Vibrio parahaemolyticus]ELJ8846757.1 FRG domain-containing protein [Vibrio parahaemolyticus]MDW1950573.1 FRG domain-containing protein [Vibrio sp. 812(2023)]MDW1993634.1 FRG domain-containing protein [Vibrio sp. 780]HAS6868495.1 FRG domain-containing protein [Vibrio parahaemolyticus]